jgi:hypothetical protein
MKLSDPNKLTWWIVLVVGVLGLLGPILSILLVSANAF